MDPLDFAVYRFLSPGGEARFWAGRRVLDPRITPREIAAKVGLSESGVRSRLRHLVERGFLRDRAVVPNPSLFDRQVYVADLLVSGPGEVSRLRRDVGLVEGVVFVRDLMDEDQRKTSVYYVADGPTSAARAAALLGRLSPSGRPVLPRPYFIPASERALTPLEWRVLETVWRAPDASIAEIGGSAHVSLKTAARIYHHLLDSRACWWTHGPGSEEFPLALVSLELKSPRGADSVAEKVRAETPAWMPVAGDGSGQPPEESLGTLAGLVPADVPTVLERFLRTIAALEGVARVRRTFALGSAAFPDWYGENLARHARAGR